MKKIIVYGRAALVVVAIACVFDLARAAEPSQSADEAAIRKATADYLEARKRGDFDAIRAFWTATGNIVDETGRRISVRDIQPPASTDGKDTIPPVEIKLLANSIHFVTPNVAIEDGTSDSGSGSNGTTTRGRFSAVWVKQNGKWLIDSLREAAIADQPTTNSLQSLEWLIGNWVEPEDATAFMASFKWSEGKHYLIGEVRIQPARSRATRGQPANCLGCCGGLDPLVEFRLRRWVFLRRMVSRWRRLDRLVKRRAARW